MGFNYLSRGSEDNYHASFPNRPTMATEEGSLQSTRGIYTNSSTYQDSYDNHPSHTYTMEQLWQFYLARPWNAGNCNWTGFDYRGEPTPFSWPNISSEFGVLDTCGLPKDISYYLQANWTPKTVLHIFPHWNWPTPGQIINVWGFSTCDAVELFLNGLSQGRQTNSVLNHLQWSVAYAPGTLQAVGYHHGQPVVTNTQVTTGAPAGISLTPDRNTILADGRDVSMVTVAVVDSQGRVVPTATNTLNFSVTGGAIIGVGNGDPAAHEADRATNNVWPRSAFSGLAQVIVQSTNQAGVLGLTATAVGLNAANATIVAAANLPPPAAPTGVFALPDAGQVTVSWDVVPHAITYNVKRAPSSGGPYTLLVTNTASLGYTDTDVVNGATYYYVVSALDGNGEGMNSIEVAATPSLLPPVITAQPGSFSNASPIYAGVPIAFSVAADSAQPISYQWFQVVGGVINAIAGATNASYSHFSQTSDANRILGYFAVVSSGSMSVTSAVANLTLTKVVPGVPGAISIQYTITNYSGYTGFFLAPTDTAGVYAVSNWNVFAITPASGSSGTQPGVSRDYLLDWNGVITPVSVSVVNASDGWHQKQTITSADTANAKLMNTYWKVNPAKSAPSTNTLYLTLANVPTGVYTAYIYLMQNNAATGYVCSATGPTNYYKEFINFNSSSNFVTAVDTNGGVNPSLNYLKLAGLSTGSANTLPFTFGWVGGGDGIGVCGIQLVPAVTLTVGPRTNGQFSLQFPAPAGQSYVVEASDNLLTWTPVLTNTSTGGQFIFCDTNASGRQRFYRIKQ
jgi:hypothetical protein